MADTLKQVQLDRQRLIENNKGASESSRAALSAISGRNVLKTKSEVEKLRRNEEIARQQNAALAGVAGASNAIAMEKARLADARHEESLGLRRERLALSRSNFDLQRQRLEDQKKRDQKNDVLSMLNMGIFDPSFAATLEMPEDLVRQAAANKKAQIDATKARKAAAAKAEADYKNALKLKDDAKSAEKTAAQKGVDKAIGDAEKNGTVSGTAAEAKEGILSNAYVNSVAVNPPAFGLNLQALAPASRLDRFAMPGSVAEKKMKERAEQAGVVSKEESDKIQKENSDYYDETMTRRVYEKEKAGDELSPLENLFKTENENSTAYTLRSKRFAAEDQMAAAVTPEEVNTAYNEYLSALDEKRVEVIGTAIELQDRYLEKQEAAETFTPEELEQIEETKVQLEEVRSLMVKEIDGGLLNEEGKKLLQTEIENIDAAIEVLESAYYYEEHFEEHRDELEYRKMDSEYGTFTDTDIEELIADLEGQKRDSDEFLVVLNKGRSVGTEAAIDARKEYAEIEQRNAELDQQIQSIRNYLDQRTQKAQTAEQDEAARETLDGWNGATLTEQYRAFMSGNEIAPSYLDELRPTGYDKWTDEQKKAWDDDFNKKWYEMTPAERDEYLKDAQFTYSESSEATGDSRKEVSDFFYRNIVSANESLFTEEQLEQLSEEAFRNYKNTDHYKFSGELTKYNDGIDGLYEGDYSEFRNDLIGFLKGDYKGQLGDFTEKDAKTILALMTKYGTDEAFVHYAAVRDQALKRRAEGFTEFGQIVRGGTSGLTQFMTNGGEMLENAFTQQYSRIAGTLGTASHQINMEEFSRNTGIVSEAAEMLYMAGYSIFEMVPAVALGAVPYVGGALSSAYTFAKVTATSYNDSILQGKRADEALTYSILTATAEVGLEKVLGTGGQTFAKTGVGKVWKEAVENLSATKAMKVIIKTAGSMGSEGFEEFLQECLSPFLEKVAADLNGIDGATLKEIDWDEAAKSFAIGALTGGVFGGIESISSAKNGGMKESEAQALLESGRAVEIIHAAAELGNRRAMNIKRAMQNNQSIYEGQQGLYAYASVADMVNMAQSIKRRTVRSTLSRLEAKYAEQQTDEGKRKEFKRLFKKILQGNTLTLQETANIINDPAMADVLNEMLGMDVVTMLPDRVRAMTKLLAFAPDGKISKERLNLFRDAFGEIDAKAIEDILTYSDMGAKKGAGIIFEDADTQLTETEQEAAEVLKLLSTEVGTVFYVTEQFETGTYLAANVMAVKKGDLAGGVFKSATHRAYYMAKQLMADKGVNFKAFLLGEAKRIKGDEAVENEIKTILRQSAENGNDISERTAEDELCARMLGELLQQEGVLDRLAAADLDMVAVLRKALAAVQEHLDETIGELHVDQDLHDYINRVIENRENPDENIEVGEDFEVWKITDQHAQWMAEEIKKEAGIEMDLTGYTIVFPKSQVEHTWRRHGKNGKADSSMSKTEDFAKIRWYLEHSTELKVARHKDGNLKLHRRYKNSDGSKAIMVSLITHLKGTDCYVSECVPDVKSKTMYVLSVYKNSSNNKRMNIEASASPHHTPEASLNDVTAANNSISNSYENVNNDSEFSFFDGGSEDVTDLVERLTALVRGEEVATDEGAEREADFDIDSYADQEFTYSDAEQVRAENDGAESAKNFENMTPEEQAEEIADLQSEIDAIMTADISEQLEREEGSRESDYRDPVDRVGAKRERQKEPFGKEIRKGWNLIRREFADSGQTIYDIGKKIKDDFLYAYYNMARASQQAGVTMISKWQSDVTGKMIGKSLQEIWAPIKAKGKGYANNFDTYLLHLHNIDRMSRYDPEALAEARHQYEVEKAYLSEELRKMSDDEIRAISHDRDSAFVGEARDYINALDNYNHIRNIKDKPVFGYDVSAEDSRAAVENFERLYPEFKEYREAVYQYIDNLLQYRVDSGLISAETKAMLKKIYPHYVPTARVQAEETTAQKHQRQKEKNREQTKKIIGKARGGDSNIISLYDQIAGQTMSVVREGSKNRLGVRLLRQKESIGEIKNAELYSDKLTDPLLIDRHLDEIDPFMTVENKNIFGVFKDGEFWEMEVTNELWEAVQALDNEKVSDNIVLTALRWNVDTFKRLITSLNPIFAIRNPIKDIADGLFYSKDTKRWLSAMPAAIKEMATKGDLWKQYVALGGGFSTYFDFTRMGTKDPKGFGKIAGRIEAANQAIEQFPRFAEFIATVRKGNGSMENLMEAMHNAADITTNFGRSGRSGRWLNRYLIPFFNPSIQGMSKAVRAWTEQRSVKGFVALGAKAVFFGVAPAVINALLYQDDEEWDQIKQTDKDRYFLFKIKDGLWARIPKGRMLSVFGGIGDRALQAMDGEEFEWASLIQTTVDQMAPSNPIESNIVGPVFLALNNKTWYGTEIVGERLKNEPNAEQYDTKTDEISKWIGSVTGWSPKKINYVLDAYGGIVADVLLPALTPAAERTVLGNAFSLDTNYSNRLSGDFYDKMDELSDQKNSVKATVEDAVLYRWWNRNADTVSEINAEIRKIEEDQTLTAKEKKEKVNEQYVIRNAAMLGFEENYDRYAGAVKKYSEKAIGMSEDDAKEYIYREANREIFGTEYALKAYGTSTYERAVRVRDEQGIDFDTFYDVYFDAEEPDVEKCFLLIEDGFEKEPALEIARNIGALEPVNGAKSVSAIQKYGAIDVADITEDEKLWAMTVLASETDRCRVTVLADYSVTLKQFIAVKDNVAYLDKKTEGGVTNALVKAAVDDVEGLNGTQRAALWQLFTGSSSAKNNPYSAEIGSKALVKNKALKEAEE